MTIEITFSLRTHMNFAERVNRYDDFMGCMVRGFHFRLRPVYMSITWAAK